MLQLVKQSGAWVPRDTILVVARVPVVPTNVGLRTTTAASRCRAMRVSVIRVTSAAAAVRGQSYLVVFGGVQQTVKDQCGLTVGR